MRCWRAGRQAGCSSVAGCIWLHVKIVIRISLCVSQSLCQWWKSLDLIRGSFKCPPQFQPGPREPHTPPYRYEKCNIFSGARHQVLMSGRPGLSMGRNRNNIPFISPRRSASELECWKQSQWSDTQSSSLVEGRWRQHFSLKLIKKNLTTQQTQY